MKQVIEHGQLRVAGQEYTLNTVYPMGRLYANYWVMQVKAIDGTEHNFATPEAYGRWADAQERALKKAKAWRKLMAAAH
jgi:hypothetical protein